jgi:hypothetical protein
MIALAALIGAVVSPSSAQWLNFPTRGFPGPLTASPTSARRRLGLRTVVTERHRRTNFGHMDLEMTFDDPKAYVKPFTIKVG